MRFVLPLLFIVVGATGCRPASPSSAAGATSDGGRSPLQTLEQLIALHEQHRYQQMYPLITSTDRHDVVKYLRVADEFLTANDQLCRFVRDEIGIGLSQSIDRSRLAGNLHIFSRYVTLLDETIEGERATVGFLVDEQLPARRARLVRKNGQWLYDPGGGDHKKIIAAVQLMADGLRRVLRELQSGGLDRVAMRKDPEKLIDAVRIRLLPGVKALPPRPPTGDGG